MPARKKEGWNADGAIAVKPTTTITVTTTTTTTIIITTTGVYCTTITCLEERGRLLRYWRSC